MIDFQTSTESNSLEFSEFVCKEIGNYVYRLIDPRNGETFYIGKGTNNRVFGHIKDRLILSDDEDNTSLKILRIRAIRESGLSVIHIIHRHGIPEEAVFEVEAALIDAYSGLSNISLGHGSNDTGPMHTEQLINKYALPVIDWEPKHKLVLINVNRFDSTAGIDLYDQLRFSWRISRKNAEKADYVLAVVRGIVIGTYKADYWKPATKENFPEILVEEPKRNAFSGNKAEDEIWEMYCGQNGKRIAIEEMRHVQYPIRYWPQK